MSSATLPKPRRTWSQRAILGLNVVIVVIAGISALVLAYVKDTVSDVDRVSFGSRLDVAETASGASTDGADDAAVVEEAQKPALNFLLVGVDSISGLPSNHILRQTRSGTQLTDTLIVLRIDPNTGVASAMSIPRDLWVPIAGGGEDKINSALAFTGEAGLVQTVQEALDIPIHRYIQVNFSGFLELIRILGGIDVQLDYPLRDPKAQFEVLRTGCVTLTPDEALGYVRARTLRAQINGEWVRVDSNSDLGRISRQQDFLVLAINKAFSQGMTNPSTLKSLLDNVAGYVTLDDVLTPQELVDLASDFSGFAGDDLERFTLPVVVGSAGDASVVRLVEAEAEEVLAVFRGEVEQTRRVRVVVRNGEGTPGLATDAQYAIGLRGYNVVDASNADGFAYETSVIRHDPSQTEDAEALERWLVAGAVLEPREADGGGPIELVVGADWQGVLDIARPAPESDLPVPGSEVVTTETPTVTPEPTAVPTPTPTPSRVATIRGC